MSGQGLSLAGVVVSANHLNEKLKGNKRYEHFNVPDASYHDIVYADMTDRFDIYTLRMRLAIVRDIGAVISPFNSWQLIQGLETLAVRVERHSQNALKVAKFLNSHKHIKSVAYPGLADNVDHAKAQKYFKDGMANGLFCFETDSFERAKKMLERVKLFQFQQELKRCMELLNMDSSYASRDLNVGFSGGERKKAEILQLLMLHPELAILDETDSGLDVDAVRTVSKGIEEYQKNWGGSLLVITHSTRILDNLAVDRTHVMVKGAIVESGDASLVKRINEGGFEVFEENADSGCE